MKSAASSRAGRASSRSLEKAEAWLGFSAMALFIFATLEGAPILSRFLWQRALFMSTLTWLFGITAFFLLHYILSVVALRSPPRLAALLALGLLYAWVLLRTGRVERFHMLEYGALSFLGLRALSLYLGGLLLYPAGSLLVFLVSLADEGLQEWLPSRYFAWEDVLVNGRSIGLAALLLACVHGRNTAGFRLPFFGEDRRPPH